MGNIRCSTCKQILDVSFFYKNAYRKNGFNACCKECSKIFFTNYYKKTKQLKRQSNIDRVKKWRDERYNNFHRYIQTMYLNIALRVSHSGNRKKYWDMEICEKDDFISFAKKDKRLFVIYKTYLNSGRVFSLCPSVDRIDPNKGYLISNIQFLTVSENSKKKRLDNKLFIKNGG